MEGLIHVSEMSWTKRIKHPSKVLAVGDTVEAVVLDVDQEGRRLSLGLRQTEPNPWDLIAEKYHVGDRITGKVRNLTDFGAFVEVEEGIEGLIHVSEMSEERVEQPKDVLSVGDVVKAKIIKLDAAEQKVGLSIKAVLQDLTQEELRAYMDGQQRDSASTIGDAMEDSDFLDEKRSGREDRE